MLGIEESFRTPTSSIVINMASKFNTAYARNNLDPYTDDWKQGTKLRWRAPPNGWFKHNIDGPTHGDLGTATVGDLLHDS